MRINDNNASGINPSAIGGRQQVRAANEQSAIGAKPGDSAKKGDNVQFSTVASHVSAESLSINQTASIERAARIGQLTKLVQSGQYNPDPKQIADSMIRDMLSGTGSS